MHIFERVCREHGIEHRLTKPNHPWTNGQVERMNRTLKDATVKRYHYDSHDQLRAHLQLFLDAYNHARRLKTLRGLTPYEYVCQVWTKEPNASDSTRHITYRDHTVDEAHVHRVLHRMGDHVAGHPAANHRKPLLWAVLPQKARSSVAGRWLPVEAVSRKSTSAVRIVRGHPFGRARTKSPFGPSRERR